MLRVNEAFRLVRKHHWLWLLPVIISLAGLGINLLRLGLWPLTSPGFRIRVTLTSSLPLSGDILATPNLVTLSIPFGIFMLSLILLLIRLFLTGGYLAGAVRLLKGESIDAASFWSDCRYFFGRLLSIT